MFLAGLLLAVLVAHDGTIRGRAGLAAVMVMVLLPLSGANGIVIAGAMAPWLVAEGLAHLGAPGLRAPADPPRRRTGYALHLGAATVLAMIAIYFVGYERPEWSPPLASGPELFQAAKTYFAYALGPGARREELAAAALVLGFVVCGAGLALRAVVVGRPEERLRASGLTLYICAGLALAVAIALARGAYPYRMPDRYALLAVLPLLGSAYAWDLYAPRRIGRAAVAGLALLLLALMPLNVWSGFQWRNWYVSGMRQVEADIAAGTAIPALAQRHYPFLMHWSEDRLREAMQMLHSAGIGPFADAAADHPPN